MQSVQSQAIGVLRLMRGCAPAIAGSSRVARDAVRATIERGVFTGQISNIRSFSSSSSEEVAVVSSDAAKGAVGLNKNGAVSELDGDDFDEFGLGHTQMMSDLPVLRLDSRDECLRRIDSDPQWYKDLSSARVDKVVGYMVALVTHPDVSKRGELWRCVKKLKELALDEEGALIAFLCMCAADIRDAKLLAMVLERLEAHYFASKTSMLVPTYTALEELDGVGPGAGGYYLKMLNGLPIKAKTKLINRDVVPRDSGLLPPQKPLMDVPSWEGMDPVDMEEWEQQRLPHVKRTRHVQAVPSVHREGTRLIGIMALHLREALDMDDSLTPEDLAQISTIFTNRERVLKGTLLTETLDLLVHRLCALPLPLLAPHLLTLSSSLHHPIVAPRSLRTLWKRMGEAALHPSFEASLQSRAFGAACWPDGEQNEAHWLRVRARILTSFLTTPHACVKPDLFARLVGPLAAALGNAAKSGLTSPLTAEELCDLCGACAQGGIGDPLLLSAAATLLASSLSATPIYPQQPSAARLCAALQGLAAFKVANKDVGAAVWAHLSAKADDLKPSYGLMILNALAALEAPACGQHDYRSFSARWFAANPDLGQRQGLLGRVATA